MAEDERVAEEPLPDAMAPERWETAIEDFAQVAALVLDRAQDLVDTISDLMQARPVIAKAIVAAVAGAAVGVFVATRLPRRRPPTVGERAAAAAREATARGGSALREATGRGGDALREATGRGASIMEEAVAVALSAAERLARRVPSGDVLIERIPQPDGLRPIRLRMRRPDTRQVRQAAQLVPIALTLLRNPLVRSLLLRAAMRAASRGR